MTFKIALRNILRNTRRSAVTLSAIAVGVVAMLLFGAFMAQVTLGFQTSTVQRAGHLTLFKTGYFEFGTGNPSAYGISHYPEILALVRQDPVLAPLLNAATPTIALMGLAANPENNTSKNFFGLGVVPGERNHMRVWDEYKVMSPEWRRLVERGSGLSDAAPTRAVTGIGLARQLGLCAALKIVDCANTQSAPLPLDTPVLASLPRINLLAASGTGAPNIVGLDILRADFQGTKEIDDGFIAMHLSAAQKLLFGAGEPKVTSLVLQLHRTEDMAAARARLQSLIAAHKLDLEVRDFAELTPMYVQALMMFRAIFGFIAVIMGVIVLFVVVNTMSMSVIERTNEIGVSRAMGVRRSGIRRQFLTEGCILGVVGATLGVVLALLVGTLFNHSGLTWTPPGQGRPIPLQLLLGGTPLLVVGIWVGLVVIATLAAWIPANRAARMQAVDALRHV